MSKGDYDFLNRVILRAILSSPPPPVRIYSGGPIPKVNQVSSKGISTSGMEGFSEEGAPGDWDMAIGEVYGYRWWKMPIPAELAGVYIENRSPYVSSGGIYPLFGANGCNWGPGRLEAECPRNSYDMSPAYRAVVHEPPEYREACGCGFWAYFNPRLDVTQVFSGLSTQNPYRVGNDVHLPVLGVVKGTGRVIIGTKGFRSQYAEIMGLCVPDIAKTQLHWNIEQRVSYGERFGWTDIYTALRGGSSRSPWYSNHYPDGVVTQASETERLRRYAAVEALLSVSYPDAYVLSDENALRSYFGADKNYYHPANREHPPFW